MMLGLGVVLYLLYTQVDLDTISNITWGKKEFGWLMLGVLSYVARHLFYAWRLRTVSSNFFSWLKSIELIFIWEFASSISPMSIGGSAVALFLLAQERLSGAKTISIVIYTAVLDGIFFIVSLIGLIAFFGPIIVRPGMHSMQDNNGYGTTFYILLVIMTLYSTIFFYGIFINPRHFKRFLIYLSTTKILKRFKKNLYKNAIEIESTSATLLHEPWHFHLKAFIGTAGAWIMRFLAINFFILALAPDAFSTLYEHLLVYSRGEVMYVITSFSPTPGASGVAEYLFAGFYSDYVQKDIAVIIAMIWRLVSYYLYLIAGILIIPNWIRKIINRKRSHTDELA